MRDRRDLGTVLALTIVAVVLRALIVGQSTWADELFLYEIVHDNGLRRALEIVHDTESTPPLYFVLAWLSAQLGSDDFLLIRLPALLLSAATVPVIHALGVRTVGRTAAVIAAALFAIVPFDLFYGTEGRGYAAVAFFSAAATLSLVALAQTGRRRWAVALAVAVAGAAYSHYLAAFVLVVLFVFGVLVYRHRRALILAAYAGAALLYVPWIPGALHQFEDNTSDRLTGVGGAGEMAETIVRVWVGHPFVPLSGIPGRPAAIVVALGLVLAAAFALLRASRDRVRPAPGTLLLILLAAATPAAALLYELGESSVFGARYFSASAPAGLLVIGALLAAARRPVVVALATAAVVGGIAVGTVKMLQADYARPDYRALATYVDRVAAPGEPVLELSVGFGPPSRNTGFYFERPHEYFADGRPATPAFALGHETGELHLIGPEPGMEAFAPLLDLEGRGFRHKERKVWPGIVPLAIDTWESTR